VHDGGGGAGQSSLCSRYFIGSWQHFARENFCFHNIIAWTAAPAEGSPARSSELKRSGQLGSGRDLDESNPSLHPRDLTLRVDTTPGLLY